MLADINDSMLKMGREKLRNIGIVGNVEYVQANAEALPFADNTFDCITISFGLRNVTDKEKALRSMYRVLKPGGRLLVLEFSKPIIEPLSKAYDAYSFHILPKVGELVAKMATAIATPAESIRMHPDRGNPERDDAGCGLRKRGLLQPDGGYRCFASRLQVLTGGTLCLSHPRLPLALKRR